MEFGGCARERHEDCKDRRTRIALLITPKDVRLNRDTSIRLPSEKAVEAAEKVASNAEEVLNQIHKSSIAKERAHMGGAIPAQTRQAWSSVTMSSLSGNNDAIAPIAFRDDKSPAALAVAAARMARAAAAEAEYSESGETSSAFSVSPRDFLLFKPNLPDASPDSELFGDHTSSEESKPSLRRKYRESELKELAKMKLRLKSLESSVQDLQVQILNDGSEMDELKPLAATHTMSRAPLHGSHNPEADETIENLLRQLSAGKTFDSETKTASK